MTFPAPSIKVLILGGAGEIGMNSLVIEKNHRLIMIDCGLAFPAEENLGVELKIPDFQWVIERAKNLDGIILTHGHEDHIGALPYLLKHIKPKIYATAFTLELVKEKLREHKLLKKSLLNQIYAGERIKIGEFDMEFIQTSHSIVDGVAVAIHTEQGIILHSGDFKIDPTPIDGKKMDLTTFSRLGEQGVLAFFSDSTNVEQEGYTPSEREVGKALLEIFQQAKGRVIVAVFASHIHRIQQVLDCAHQLKRKVLVYGRSIESTTKIAHRLGYLSYPPNLLVSLSQAQTIIPERLVILTTGSQAEPKSVLRKMASSAHPKLKIIPGDTVVLSSKLIPGNEKAIENMINDLYRLGAEVFYEKVSEIHCSGHAGKEELKLMLELVKPSYLVPIHGEYRHLVKHKELALEMGMKPEQCLVVENGSLIEFKNRKAQIKKSIELVPEFVDDGRREIPAQIVKQRAQMASQGAVFVSLSRNNEKSSFKLKLKTFGLVPEREYQGLIFEAQKKCGEKIKPLLELNASKEELEKAVKNSVKKFFKKRLGKNPAIIVNIF